MHETFDLDERAPQRPCGGDRLEEGPFERLGSDEVRLEGTFQLDDGGDRALAAAFRILKCPIRPLITAIQHLQCPLLQEEWTFVGSKRGLLQLERPLQALTWTFLRLSAAIQRLIEAFQRLVTAAPRLFVPSRALVTATQHDEHTDVLDEAPLQRPFAALRALLRCFQKLLSPSLGPMRTSMNDELTTLVLQCRRKLLLSAEKLAQLLGTSKRTVERHNRSGGVRDVGDVYVLIRALHPHDRGLAHRMATAAGTSLAALQVEAPLQGEKAAPLPVERPELLPATAEAVVACVARGLALDPKVVRAVLSRALVEGQRLGVGLDALSGHPQRTG